MTILALVKKAAPNLDPIFKGNMTHLLPFVPKCNDPDYEGPVPFPPPGYLERFASDVIPTKLEDLIVVATTCPGCWARYVRVQPDRHKRHQVTPGDCLARAVYECVLDGLKAEWDTMFRQWRHTHEN